MFVGEMIWFDEKEYVRSDFFFYFKEKKDNDYVYRKIGGV